MPTKYIKELEEARDSALSWLKPATRETMKWFRADFQVDLKADMSPVTIADRRAEEILRKKIHSAFPEHGIIGEEFGNESPNREWVWTIDPIDGTRSFVRGLPLFSTLLALLHRGEPVLGVLCLPALGETAWAVKGKGAHCNGRRLQVSEQATVKGATLATADVYCFREKKKMSFLQRLHKEANLVRTYPDAFGHFLALCGSMDAMVDPWAYIWDYAPIKILATEAGGAFANFSGNKGSLTEGTALVGNPKIVAQLQKIIREEQRKPSARFNR